MSELNQKMSILNNQLEHALLFLNEMDESNFNFNLGKATEAMKNAQKLRLELKSAYSMEELMEYDPELTELAKLISVKYDNIISIKKIEMGIVAKKLEMIQNQRKLANYNR